MTTLKLTLHFKNGKIIKTYSFEAQFKLEGAFSRGQIMKINKKTVIRFSEIQAMEYSR